MCAPLPGGETQDSLQLLSEEEVELNCCHPHPPSYGQFLEPSFLQGSPSLSGGPYGHPNVVQGTRSRAGTYKADASFATGNKGAHVLWPTEEGDHGDIQLL